MSRCSLRASTAPVASVKRPTGNRPGAISRSMLSTLRGGAPSRAMPKASPIAAPRSTPRARSSKSGVMVDTLAPFPAGWRRPRCHDAGKRQSGLERYERTLPAAACAGFAEPPGESAAYVAPFDDEEMNMQAREGPKSRKQRGDSGREYGRGRGGPQRRKGRKHKPGQGAPATSGGRGRGRGSSG